MLREIGDAMSEKPNSDATPEKPKSLADVHAAAYRAYVEAMKEGMANIDVDALDIPTGGLENPTALPSCHCVGTLYCMGHFGCAGGCVMCAGTVGTIMCYKS